MANVALIRGAAMAAPKFTDIRAAVEPGIQSFKQTMNMRQKEKEEQEKADKLAKALNDKKQAQVQAEFRRRYDDAADEYNSFLAKYDENEVPPYAQDSFAELLKESQKEYLISTAIEDKFESNKLKRTAEQKVDEFFDFYQKEKANSAAYIDLQEKGLISDANDFDSFNYKVAIARAKGFKSISKDGSMLTYEIDGKDVEIPKKEINKYKVIPNESVIFLNTQKLLESKLAEIKRNNNFPGSPTWDLAVNNIKNQIKIQTPEQALSILVDHFKTGGAIGEHADLMNKILSEDDPMAIINSPEEFKYADINEVGEKTGDILTGSEGIIEFAKDQFLKQFITASKGLEVQKEAIDDAKDKKPPNDFVILGEDIATNILKDPISQFEEFSDAPVKYDKLNKIVTIETGVDKEGNKLQPEKFNLNKEPEYLRFIDFVLLQSSYTSSEKSKILNGARKWVKKRSGMFEAKNTDMTSSDLLGLPVFN